MEALMLEGLAEEDRRRILSAARRRSYSRGEVLFHEGDAGTTLHILMRGHVAVRASTPSGDVVTLSVVGPGDIFGELALVRPRHERTATVVALESVETATLDQQAFDRLRHEHPAVDHFLVTLLARRVARLSAHLVEALHVPAEQRVLRRLLALVALYQDGPLPVAVPLTQEDLASMAGTSRPTTNRVLRQMEELKALQLTRGRIEVLDLAPLRRHAGLSPR
ncbi:Crp/Fnr family transcriptional regulator [Geodermatophilus sp. CPCC 205506]|uniref:Crp/Fnr family transcriptional regulator n=1 Tax=Geodermatophilus sp. CPCC 205506 TaxID=2936596 RepID=UPI003EEFE5E1